MIWGVGLWGSKALSVKSLHCSLSWAGRDHSHFGQQAKLLSLAAKGVDALLGLGRMKACITHKRKRDFLALGVPRAVRVRGEWRR